MCSVYLCMGVYFQKAKRNVLLVGLKEDPSCKKMAPIALNFLKVPPPASTWAGAGATIEL